MTIAAQGSYTLHPAHWATYEYDDQDDDHDHVDDEDDDDHGDEEEGDNDITHHAGKGAVESHQETPFSIADTMPQELNNYVALQIVKFGRLHWIESASFRSVVSSWWRPSPW